MQIVILLIVAFLLVSFVFASKSFAPWIPSRKRDLERIFRLANLKPGQIFYDLGCGDGRLVFYAAKHFKVKAIGMEISLPLILFCKIKQIFHHQHNLIFKWKNLFKEDLSKANAVFVFGTHNTIQKNLKPKVLKELKPGARLISYAFALQGLKPIEVDKPSDNDIPIYLYIF